jgi:hypothetical protein
MLALPPQKNFEESRAGQLRPNAGRADCILREAASLRQMRKQKYRHQSSCHKRKCCSGLLALAQGGKLTDS